MKISAKILEVLKAISVINQGVILREDYLYTKFEESDEVKTKVKGTHDILINYNVPKDELELDLEIGISNISDFLSVINTYDQDTLSIDNNGLDLLLKDNRKKGTYVSQTTSILPEKKAMGDVLYDEGEEVVKFVLSQVEKDIILKDLAPINPESLSLVSEDGKIYLVAANETTGNSTKITLSEEANVTLAEGDFDFPNPTILSHLINDDFKVTVVNADLDGEDIKIINFEAVGVKGLSYRSVYMLDE